MSIEVLHLFVSSGHNYFGHHGQPAGQSPASEVTAVECVAGRGLRGDRFFDYKENYKGQITFFASEVYEELCTMLRARNPQLSALNAQPLPSPSASVSVSGSQLSTLSSQLLPPPSATRRNVITRGVDLITLIGQPFEIQGVRFEGMSECSPCYWMDQAFAPGANDFLKGRGGLRARILTDGWLRAGSINPHTQEKTF